MDIMKNDCFKLPDGVWTHFSITSSSCNDSKETRFSDLTLSTESDITKSY